MRSRVLIAGLLLVYARVLIAFVPLRFWRARLGLVGPAAAADSSQQAASLACAVERAAARLPIAVRCLPRAVALSMLLRHAGIAHRVVFAVGPRERGDAADRLHAIVRHGEVVLIGDEPGPWIEIFAVGAA